MEPFYCHSVAIEWFYLVIFMPVTSRVLAFLYWIFGHRHNYSVWMLSPMESVENLSQEG